MTRMILLTPGPTPIPPTVLDAIARPVTPHRTQEFEALYARCHEGLQRYFRTTGPVLTLASSGTGAMEAAIWSLAAEGASIVVGANGKFSERWEASAGRFVDAFGGSVLGLAKDWGEPVTTDDLNEALDAADDVRLIVLTHCETSTATISDVASIAARARERAPDALIVVDGITSVGAVEVEADEWGIDAVVCASQKSPGLPPGLGFVALSQRAAEQLRARKETAAPLYLDLCEYLAAHDDCTTPYTPAINLHFGLAESLRLIDEEGGVVVRWEHSRRMARACRDAFAAMGLELPSKSPSDSVTAVRAPEGLADRIRAWCKSERAVILAGGQGPWKGQVFRMSHMGFIGAEETITGVEAVGAALKALAPNRFEPDKGVDLIREKLIHEAPR